MKNKYFIYYNEMKIRSEATECNAIFKHGHDKHNKYIDYSAEMYYNLANNSNNLLIMCYS